MSASFPFQGINWKASRLLLIVFLFLGSIGGSHQDWWQWGEGPVTTAKPPEAVTELSTVVDKENDPVQPPYEYPVISTEADDGHVPEDDGEKSGDEKEELEGSGDDEDGEENRPKGSSFSTRPPTDPPTLRPTEASTIRRPPPNLTTVSSAPSTTSTTRTPPRASGCNQPAEYACLSGDCISVDKVCDNFYNCKDHSDETNCMCRYDQFKCKVGKCIAKDKVCDQRWDCFDGSDEGHCNEKGPTCPRGMFMCKSGSCLPIHFLCNRDKDCSEGEDEINCNYDVSEKPSILPLPFRQQCRSHEIRCLRSNQCIRRDVICDGIKQCEDGSDEQNCEHCTSDQVQCDDGKCIHYTKRCNSRKDCDDLSDEKECGRDLLFNVVMLPKNVKANEGDEVTMSCQDEGPYGAQIFWSRSDNRPLRGSFEVKYGRSLMTITNVGLEDDGEYICTLGNNMPRASGVIWASSYLTVSSRYANKRDDKRGDVPANVVMNCPRNSFLCINSGKCIHQSLRCDSKADCDQSEDEQNCFEDNRIDSSFIPVEHNMETINIKVYDTPQNHPLGHDVVFRCRDEGSLRLPVYWRRRDGRPLPLNAHVVENVKTSRLTLVSIRAEDGGHYVCSPKGYSPGNNAEKETFLTVTQTEGDVLPHPPYPTYAPQPPQPPYPTYPPPPPRPEPTPTPSRRPLRCRFDEYPCTSGGQCFSRNQFCDNAIDCRDTSDEAFCEVKCESSQFQCMNKKCVSKASVCDNRDDCGDHSDEFLHCKKTTSNVCRYNEFQCKDRSKCIPSGYICDGLLDCDDRSDEQRCAAPTFIDVYRDKNVYQVIDGQSVTLNCYASGYPLPSIRWRFNLEPVSISPRITFCFDCKETQCDPSFSYSSITIINVSKAERGYWGCEANGLLSPYYVYLDVI